MLPRRTLLVTGLTAGLLVGCSGPQRVLVKFSGEPGAAHVYINDRFIARLDQLGKSGVRLPPGEYRVTVKEIGYFPVDQLLVVDANTPAVIDIEMTKIPD
jgi:hypothetical protein